MQRFELLKEKRKLFAKCIIIPTSIKTMQDALNINYKRNDLIIFSINSLIHKYEGLILWTGFINSLHAVAVKLKYLDDYILDYMYHGSLIKDETVVFLELHNQSEIESYLDHEIFVLNEKTMKTFSPQLFTEKSLVIIIDNVSWFVQLKWKGSVDGIQCLCLNWKPMCGTDGTFKNIKFFQSPSRNAVMIPVQSISYSCEIEKKTHKKINLFDNLINPYDICCYTNVKGFKDNDLKVGIPVIGPNNIGRGICKWIGWINNVQAIGIELDYGIYIGTNGKFGGIEFFQCEVKKGVLVRVIDVNLDFHRASSEKIENLITYTRRM